MPRACFPSAEADPATTGYPMRFANILNEGRKARGLPPLDALITAAQSRRPGESSLFIVETHPPHGVPASGGVLDGGRRCPATCSLVKPILINIARSTADRGFEALPASSHGRIP